MRKLLIGIISVLVMALLWFTFAWQPTTRHSDVTPFVAPPPKGGDFTLQSYRGPVSLSDYRGKVVVLYFGYTWCPDVCPTSLGYLTAAWDGLSEAELQQMQGLFISVDPEGGSVIKIKDYAEYFHANLLGITGTDTNLAKISKQYGSAYQKVEQEDSKMGYAVDHSADLYLIDKHGKLSGAIRHGTPPKKILVSLRKLLE